MSVNLSSKQWAKALRGLDGSISAEDALSALSSRDCPDPYQGEEILEILLNHFDFQTFEKVCRAVNRGWAPTSRKFNGKIVDKVFRDDYRWLSTMLDTGMTQTDCFDSIASGNKKCWLVEIVNRGFDQSNGWQHVLGVMKKVPLVRAGGFGDVLMKSNADPDFIPQDIAGELRKVEAEELEHRKWWAQGLGARPGTSCWTRANTPLSQLMHTTKVNMQDLDGPAAAVRMEHFKTSLSAFIQDGARGDARSNAEPIIGGLGSIESYFKRYADDEHLPAIKRSLVEAFEMLAQGVRLDMYLRSPHASGEVETMAMLFADYGASLCAHLAIEKGCDPNAVDHEGNTWKMRMLKQSSCLDIGNLSEFDVCHTNKKGETILHLITMPSFLKSASFPFGEKRSPAREAKMLDALRQSLSRGLSFDQTDDAGNTPSDYLKMGEAHYAPLMAQVIAEQLKCDTSHAASASSRFRRI